MAAGATAAATGARLACVGEVGQNFVDRPAESYATADCGLMNSNTPRPIRNCKAFSVKLQTPVVSVVGQSEMYGLLVAIRDNFIAPIAVPVFNDTCVRTQCVLKK